MDRIVLSDHRQIPPIRADAFDDVVGVCERRTDGFTRLGVYNLKASLGSRYDVLALGSEPTITDGLPGIGAKRTFRWQIEGLLQSRLPAQRSQRGADDVWTLRDVLGLKEFVDRLGFTAGLATGEDRQPLRGQPLGQRLVARDLRQMRVYRRDHRCGDRHDAH